MIKLFNAFRPKSVEFKVIHMGSNVITSAKIYIFSLLTCLFYLINMKQFMYYVYK